MNRERKLGARSRPLKPDAAHYGWTASFLVAADNVRDPGRLRGCLVDPDK